MASRFDDRALRRAEFKSKLRAIVTVAIVILGVLSLFGWCIVHTNDEFTDPKTKLLRQGVGIVVGSQSGYGNGDSRYSQMLIRVPAEQNQLVQKDSAILYAPGQRVALTYKVGKSGTIYIETIQKLKATGERQSP